MHSSSYPTVLQRLVGDGYNVLNGGDGGEKTLAIMARQGALKIYLKDNLRFYPQESRIYIGNQNDTVFVSESGKRIDFTSLLGNGIPINNIKIGNDLYSLSFENFVWEPRSYSMYLSRTVTGTDITLPAGSEAVMSSTAVSKRDGVDVYLMGANGGFSTTEEFISQINSMINYHGNGKYIVIIPYWESSYDNAFASAFGSHAINFRLEAMQNGLSYEGITPTAADQNAIASYLVPASLHYNNDANNVHLNEYGYDFLAHLVYEKGKALGYY